jgi:hypothetical protein
MKCEGKDCPNEAAYVLVTKVDFRQMDMTKRQKAELKNKQPKRSFYILYQCCEHKNQKWESVNNQLPTVKNLMLSQIQFMTLDEFEIWKTLEQ